MWLLQVAFDGQVDIEEGLKKQSRKADISFHIQFTYYLKLLLRWFLVMKTVLFLSILNIQRTLFFQLINLIDYPLNQVFWAIILYLMLTPVWEIMSTHFYFTTYYMLRTIIIMWKGKASLLEISLRYTRLGCYLSVISKHNMWTSIEK